jgi:hypothetical protein
MTMAPQSLSTHRTDKMNNRKINDGKKKDEVRKVAYQVRR